MRAVYLAGSRSAAEQLAHDLATEWQKSYPKAATCLLTDLAACLRYYDYPQEHWKHLRTTNPVESVFSTMRLRTDGAKRFRTARRGVHLVFKLIQRYQKTLEQNIGRGKAPGRVGPRKAKRKTSRQDVKERNGRGGYCRMKLISKDAPNQFPQLLTRARFIMRFIALGYCIRGKKRLLAATLATMPLSVSTSRPQSLHSSLYQ